MYQGGLFRGCSRKVMRLIANQEVSCHPGDAQGLTETAG